MTTRDRPGPIFSTDGETIVFTREKPNNVREFWSVKPRGTDLKKLDAAPDWYAQAKSSPYFTNVEPQEAGSADATSSPAESASPTATPVPTYKSPDGLFELILRKDPNGEDDQVAGPGHGKHFVLAGFENRNGNRVLQDSRILRPVRAPSRQPG